MPFSAVQFEDLFEANVTALMAGTRTTEYSGQSATITDSSNQLSVTGAQLKQTGAPATAFTDPRVVAPSHVRAAGRALLGKINNNLAMMFGLNNANTGNTGNYVYGAFLGTTSMNAYSISGTTSVQVATITSATDYQVMILEDGTTGAHLFIKGGTEYPSWTYLFSFLTYTDSPLFPTVGYSSNGTRYVDWWRVIDLPSPFNSTFGWATLVQASPASGTDYAGDADGNYTLTVTAPGTLAGTTAIGVELRYRVQDANNFWTAYFREDGAFRVDSVSAGVVTNRINVAGAITNGVTRTIQIATNGSKHNAYTLAGSNWTKQGSELNISHLNSQTTVKAVLGSGWSVSNLRSVPRTSSTNYDGMHTLTGTSAKTLAAFTSSASGSPTVSGSIAVTLGALTSSASGNTAVKGSIDVTLGTLISTAAGTTAVNGSVAATLGTLTSSASGNTAIIGTGSAALDNIISTANGSPVVIGSIAVTLGALTCVAIGIVIDAPGLIVEASAPRLAGNITERIRG